MRIILMSKIYSLKILVLLFFASSIFVSCGDPKPLPAKKRTQAQKEDRNSDDQEQEKESPLPEQRVKLDTDPETKDMNSDSALFYLVQKDVTAIKFDEYQPAAIPELIIKDKSLRLNVKNKLRKVHATLRAMANPSGQTGNKANLTREQEDQQRASIYFTYVMDDAWSSFDVAMAKLDSSYKPRTTNGYAHYLHQKNKDRGLKIDPKQQYALEMTRDAYIKHLLNEYKKNPYKAFTKLRWQGEDYGYLFCLLHLKKVEEGKFQGLNCVSPEEKYNVPNKAELVKTVLPAIWGAIQAAPLVGDAVVKYGKQIDNNYFNGELSAKLSAAKDSVLQSAEEINPNLRTALEVVGNTFTTEGQKENRANFEKFASEFIQEKGGVNKEFADNVVKGTMAGYDVASTVYGVSKAAMGVKDGVGKLREIYSENKGDIVGAARESVTAVKDWAKDPANLGAAVKVVREGSKMVGKGINEVRNTISDGRFNNAVTQGKEQKDNVNTIASADGGSVVDNYNTMTSELGEAYSKYKTGNHFAEQPTDKLASTGANNCAGLVSTMREELDSALPNSSVSQVEMNQLENNEESTAQTAACLQ